MNIYAWIVAIVMICIFCQANERFKRQEFSKFGNSLALFILLGFVLSKLIGL